jgi:hypothetical protein
MSRLWLRRISISIFSILVMVLVACNAAGTTAPTQAPAASEPTRAPGAATPVVSHGGPVKDHVSFVDALRAKGLTVEVVGSIEQPFLRAKGTTLRVSGGNLSQPAELQSFNYDDTDLRTDGLKAAADDATQIEPDGNPKTMRISWIAPPHFFHKERVIVLYLGSDANVLAILNDLLGAQFAGQ